MRFVQIPTTLLAQVDSSVGGKTGHQQPPRQEPDRRLPSAEPRHRRHRRALDAAAFARCGPAMPRSSSTACSATRAFFDWLDRHWRRLFGNDPTVLTEAVERSVRAKAAIVARDETETGDRMLLNLGHTFGHALEAWAGYLQTGCCTARRSRSAWRRRSGSPRRSELCATGTAARVEAHLKAVGLPTRVGGYSRARTARRRDAASPDGAGQEGAGRAA